MALVERHPDERVKQGDDDDEGAATDEQALSLLQRFEPFPHAPVSRIWMRLLTLSPTWSVDWIEARNRPELLTMR